MRLVIILVPQFPNPKSVAPNQLRGDGFIDQGFDGFQSRADTGIVAPTGDAAAGLDHGYREPPTVHLVLAVAHRLSKRNAENGSLHRANGQTISDHATLPSGKRRKSSGSKEGSTILASFLIRA